MRVSPATAIIAIVALSALVVATVLGLQIAGVDSATSPVLTTVIGLIAPTIVALLALLRSDATQQDMREVEKNVSEVKHDIQNGTLKDTMKAAIVETVEDKNNDVQGFFYHQKEE